MMSAGRGRARCVVFSLQFTGCSLGLNTLVKNMVLTIAVSSQTGLLCIPDTWMTSHRQCGHMWCISSVGCYVGDRGHHRCSSGAVLSVRETPEESWIRKCHRSLRQKVLSSKWVKYQQHKHEPQFRTVLKGKSDCFLQH